MSTDVFRGVASFVAVVEELSFRRAAARLGVTPAAVSKAVLGLETELEVKLLERTSRAVSVTPEGAVFFAQCRVAVAAVAGARSEMSATRSAPRGEAVVSAPFILAPLVSAAVAQLRFRHPRLMVRIQVTDQMARFASERVDVAVRIGDADPGLLAKLLRKTRWRTVAAPAYLSRRGTPRSSAELAGHECLVFVAPNGRQRAWSFVDETVSVPPAMLTDHGPTLRDAALAGMGITQVLDFMVDDDVHSGRLVAVLEDQVADGPPLRALTLPGRQSANVRAIFAELGRAFSGLDR